MKRLKLGTRCRYSFQIETDDRGSHKYITLGLTKNSPNRENAIKLIEYLTSEEAEGICK